jgi:hypothetical protein
MRKMKALWLVTALLLLIAQKTIAQSAEYQCVVVETKDGERMEYLLSDNPRIMHRNAMVELTSNTVSVEFPSASVSKVYLSTTTTAVEKIKVAEGEIRMYQDVIVLKGFGENEPVALYGTDGSQLWQQSMDGNGQLVVSLNSLSKGIYIFKTNHQSFKIIRK